MKQDFLIELATLSPAAAAELGVFATNGVCSRMRARRAINAALADQGVQGPARDQLQALVHANMLDLATRKEPKSVMLQVRLTPVELEFLKELATLAGVGVSDYVRKRALA